MPLRGGPVDSRLAELDRLYWQRMAFVLPVAAAVLLAGHHFIPIDAVLPQPQKRIAQTGPLRILPEIDLVTENVEDSHRTAAPDASPPSDFLAIDIDYAESPEVAEPRPIPTPQPKEEVPEEIPLAISDLDELMDAVRTTGHPVLAQADYELVYMQRPVYPKEAVLRGIEGEVELLMLISAMGRVSQVYVVNPNRYPLLEEAAARAVAKSLFKAYIVDGKPTPFWIRVPIEFRLIN